MAIDQKDRATSGTIGYNYGLAAICKDKAALQEYAVDPYHTEVKEKFLFVNCIKEETMAVCAHGSPRIVPQPGRVCRDS
jgi:hypothetical protein